MSLRGQFREAVARRLFEIGVDADTRIEDNQTTADYVAVVVGMLTHGVRVSASGRELRLNQSADRMQLLANARVDEALRVKQ